MTRLNDVLIHMPSNHTTAKIHTHPCHISKQSKIYELYLFNSVCKICVQIFAHSSISLIKFSTATEYMQNIQNTKHTLALTCRGKCASQEVTVILLKVFFSLLFSSLLFWTYLSYVCTLSIIMCTLMFVACWWFCFREKGQRANERVAKEKVAVTQHTSHYLLCCAN